MLGEAGGGRAGMCRTREGARGEGGQRAGMEEAGGIMSGGIFAGEKNGVRDGTEEGTRKVALGRRKRVGRAKSAHVPLCRLCHRSENYQITVLPCPDTPSTLVLSDYHAERCFARGCPPPSLPLLACALNSFGPLVGRHTDQLSSHTRRSLQCSRDCEYRNCYR